MAPHLDADRLFETTARGFEVFEEHFGERTRSATTPRSSSPEFNAGAMENAGCVTLRDEYLFRSRVTAASYDSRDNTILHEQAPHVVRRPGHHDLVGRPVAERVVRRMGVPLRADEISRRHGGTDPWAAFCNARKTWAYRQDQLPSTPPDRRRHGRSRGGRTQLRRHHVRQGRVGATPVGGPFVGLEPFLAGVRTYFARHAWGNTQLSDLLEALEESSGRDLSFFTGQWLQTAPA